MDIISSYKSIKYIHRLLNGERENILNYPYLPQKPEFCETPQLMPFPRTRPENVGVSPEHIENFFIELCQKRGVNAHNIIMCRHGKVFCEASFAPYRQNIWHVSHSMCKSITSMAMGLLREEGLLSFDEKVCDILSIKPLLASAPFKKITVKHLLCMSSGVDYKEIGIVLEKDWQSAYFKSTFNFEPGKKFDYNSMNTYLLSCILKQKTGMSLMQYLSPRLFKPLGITNIKWEKSPMDIEKGGWGLYITIEDMAKLGQLMLQGGVWRVEGKEKQILPQQWVEEATKTQITNKDKNNLIEYGYQIWTRSSDGMYQFNGMFGQYVIMLPKQDMVIAMTSGGPNLATEAYALDCIYKYFAQDNQFKDKLKNSHNYKHLLKGLDNLVYETPFSVPKPNFMQWYTQFFMQKSCSKKASMQMLQLCGKKYKLDENTSGTLPLILQCMNGNLAKGIKEIEFAENNNNELILKIKEIGGKYEIPVVDGISKEFILNFSGEKFVCATIGRTFLNEDRNLCLTIILCLLESSSARKLNFAFDLTQDKLKLTLDEDPEINEVIGKLTVNEDWQSDLLELKDKGYAKYKLKQLFKPEIEGKLIVKNSNRHI